ncbi:MAG: DMT family transporter [Hyphomicrobiaceae bacterium]
MPNWTALILLFGLTLVWGLNWPAMKIALNELSVLWFRTICLATGGSLLLLLTAFNGERVSIARHQVPALMLTAVFAIVGWHLFTGYGVSQMAAGRAAIIAFLMPVFAAVFSSYLLDEPLTVSKVLGLAIGVFGLIILVGPEIVIIQRSPVGAFLMIGAACSWALGTVLFKKFRWTSPISTVVGWQLLIGLLPVCLAALILEPLPNVAAMSVNALLATTFVVLLPMVFGQWAFYKVVKLLPASLAAMSTLAIPVVGVYSSAILLGEAAGFRELVALIAICTALSIVVVVPSLKGRS